MPNASRSTNEFLILPKDLLKENVSTLTKVSQKTWNSTAKKQLYNKLLLAKETREANTYDHVIVEVHFQNGSMASFLFLPAGYSLFQAHESVRVAFQEIIKVSNNISFNLLHIPNSFNITQLQFVDALSSLVTLTMWEWEKPNYETIYKIPSKKKPKYGFYTELDGETVNSVVRLAEIKAAATNQVRTLAMLPPNKLTSQDLVEYSLQKAKKLKVASEFYDIERLKEMGAGAFTAVVQTTESSGGIVVLKRSGKGQEVCLVGKGIVFDAGGLDIKTDSSMYGMHRDMTGAAVALSTFEALAKTNKDLNLSCYLAIGENLVGPNSYKAGDVLTLLSGQTIEIENTDAEGRLLLADTLALADRELSAGALVINFATLTGSAMDVLSTKWSLAMTRDESLWENIIRSSKRSGERIHPIPISDEFQDEITSSAKITDYSQATGYAHAEHCYAAAFITEFISSDKKHIHIDLSSESRDEGLGLVSSKVTGFGVRWTMELIEQFLRSIE